MTSDWPYSSPPGDLRVSIKDGIINLKADVVSFGIPISRWPDVRKTIDGIVTDALKPAVTGKR